MVSVVNYPNLQQDTDHLKWIIHNGELNKNLEWRNYGKENTKFLIKEKFNYNDYKDDSFWKNVVSPYLNGMVVVSIAFDATYPIIESRLICDTIIETKGLQKLCFVFHRNDIGRDIKSFKRTCWIYIRDENGNIAAKSKIVGLNGFNIRGRIDIPNDLKKFKIEIKEKFDCKMSIDSRIPAIVTAISDMWLEDDNNRVLFISNLNDTSDPEIPIDGEPDPEPEPTEYATAVTPEVPTNVPYEKIWFNIEGIITRGEHYYSDEIKVNINSNNTIYDELISIGQNIPSNLDGDSIVLSDADGKLYTDTDYSRYLLKRIAIGDSTNIVVDSIP